MTAYARAAEEEQIVVRLNRGGKPATAPPAVEHPRACIPAVEEEAGIEFTESRRTGNIEVTVTSSVFRTGTAKQAAGPSALKATSIPLDVARRPHAAMPAATGDFRADLQAIGVEAVAVSQSALVESLMAPAADPSGEATCLSRGTPMFRTGEDLRLARIIDAWSGLSAKARAAMTAVLDGADSPPGQVASAGRRRSRKAANPGA